MQLHLKSLEPLFIYNLTDLDLYLMKLGVGYQYFLISSLAHNNIFDPNHILGGNMA